MELPPIERDRIGQQIAASLVAALVLTGALAAVGIGAAAHSSGPAIVLEANEDATAVDLTLTEAPNGLSGYGITLKVAGDNEANITGASYGDKFGLTESPEIDNGTEVYLKAGDVSDNVESGATDVHLATVELEGTQKGTEFATLDVNSMDDDDGGKVDPSIKWDSQSHDDPASNDDNEESNNDNQESNDNDDDSDGSSSDGASSDGSGESDDATESSTTEDDTEESGGDSEATESEESADGTDAPSTESEGPESTASDDGGEQSTTAESGDGFGVIPAVVGLLSLALYVRRTR